MKTHFVLNLLCVLIQWIMYCRESVIAIDIGFCNVINLGMTHIGLFTLIMLCLYPAVDTVGSV